MTRRPKADLNREADRQKYYGWAGWKFGHRGFSAFVYFSSNQKSDVGVCSFTKLKLFAVKRKKSNDFLADKIKCMVNSISNETQKKWRNFYPPISWPFLLRGTLFHICNRQINYHMKRKMFTITMAWLCLWQIILKILPTLHLLLKLKCEKKGNISNILNICTMYILIGGWRLIMKSFKLKCNFYLGILLSILRHEILSLCILRTLVHLLRTLVHLNILQKRSPLIGVIGMVYLELIL